MDVINQIPSNDFDDFIDIVANAFPNIPLVSTESRQRFRDRLEYLDQNPISSIYGLYRQEKLLGGMILYDYDMNLFGEMVGVGGIGLVAVELLNKKEYVAKQMLSFFLDMYREKQAPLALLYPFRPDFYRQMGFGYGTKINQYRFRPSALPQRRAKSNLRNLERSDAPELQACYNRYARNTHGMILGQLNQFERMFEDPDLRIIGYQAKDGLRGYLTFKFELGDYFIQNDLHIVDLIYEDREALSELMAFLASQFDQVRVIQFNTHDDSFQHQLGDPRDDREILIPSVFHSSNVQGVGLMYRLLSVSNFFKATTRHNFGNQTCALKITLVDSFLAENSGSTIIHFEEGRAKIAEAGFDLEIALDVAEFSSLVMGVVSFSKLYEYGLAEISNPDHIEVVNRLFKADQKPICLTRF